MATDWLGKEVRTTMRVMVVLMALAGLAYGLVEDLKLFVLVMSLGVWFFTSYVVILMREAIMDDLQKVLNEISSLRGGSAE